MPGRNCWRSRASFRAMGMLADDVLPQWQGQEKFVRRDVQLQAQLFSMKPLA